MILRSLLLLFLLVTLSAEDTKPGTGMDKPMSFDFQNTDLGFVARFLGQETGLVVQIDPAVDQRSHTISLTVKGMTCRNVLVWIGELTSTTVAEEDGQIRISERVGKGIPPKTDKVVPAELQKRLDKLMTTEFVDKDLKNAVDFIARLSGLTIVLSPRLLAAKPTVTIAAKNLKLSVIIDQIAKACGATWVVRNQAVFLDLVAPTP